MKDEIKEILVISNSPARDIQEFIRYCKSYIDKCESHKVYLKDGYILRFHSSHNLDGVRKYYLYHEIFETYLKNYITNLNQKLNKLTEAIELDLSFAKSTLKIETNPDSIKSINDLIKYDENLLKILDGKSD